MGDLDWTYPEPDGFGEHGLSDYDRYVMTWFYDGKVLAHQDQGAMVRAVMPVSLDTGQPVTLGVWVILHHRDHNLVFQRIGAEWVGSRSAGSSSTPSSRGRRCSERRSSSKRRTGPCWLG